MSDYSFGSSSLDSMSSSSSSFGNNRSAAGQPNNAMIMESVKQQIAVANAQELLSVSVIICLHGSAPSVLLNELEFQVVGGSFHF